ncbi:DUF6364 family protein [Gloeobacter morelensis]|uniref:Uncharacterized protein n=1 Tax=Gloeobacter morelensis MG652769 TaxID=2781736 RepID=A0ABY3PIR8_9CYAN|nr:DUF6364 family protein [Gloeobacter morelensis]UFP93556.1 hypothetical protein ISF26_17435 [Gloeobacter morelensis MG652769]
MQAKLTLRLDKRLIDKAKRWAASRQISVSEAVEQFFAQIPDPDAPRQPELSPWIKSLSGLLDEGQPAPSDTQLREEYLDYLEHKHQ